MNEQEFEAWYQEQIADFPPYLEGTVQEAWERCLPVWRERGRIEDKPLGIRLPIYTVWWGKFLTYEFTRKFRDDYYFLVSFLSSDDEFLRISAVELLGYLCCYFGDRPIPDELLALPHTLPQQIKNEVESDNITRRKGIDTVGDLLRFNFPPDDECN